MLQLCGVFLHQVYVKQPFLCDRGAVGSIVRRHSLMVPYCHVKNGRILNFGTKSINYKFTKGAVHKLRNAFGGGRGVAVACETLQRGRGGVDKAVT